MASPELRTEASGEASTAQLSLVFQPPDLEKINFYCLSLIFAILSEQQMKAGACHSVITELLTGTCHMAALGLVRLSTSRGFCPIGKIKTNRP